jgi:hypothetical protein
VILQTLDKSAYFLRWDLDPQREGRTIVLRRCMTSSA